MLRVIESLAKNNIIWMDCKLSNFLAFSDTDIRVGDLGLMKEAGAIIQHPGPGTRYYRPPEMFNRSKLLYAHPSMPFYSLGMTLYIAAVGRFSRHISESLNKSFSIKAPENLKHIRILYTQLEGCAYKDVAVFVDLLEKLLHSDPDQRLPLEQIKKHPFWKLSFREKKEALSV